MSRPLRPALSLLLMAAACQAVDLSANSFGDQPVAIGAGARALGMGGAFSAVADDATASTWNPAGLTQCERPELAASFGWWRTQSKVDGETDSQQAARPEHLGAFYPFFAAGCMQVVGLAWQRQYDFTRDLTWRQNYVEGEDPFEFAVDSVKSFERSGALSTIGLSYAIEPTPGLSLGLTVNQWADSWTRASSYEQSSQESNHTVISMFGMPLGEEWTTITSSGSTRVTSGISTVLGMWWQALPSLAVAVVAKPGYSLDLETEAQWHQVFDDGMTTTPSDWDADGNSTLHHPPSATFGLAWRHADLDTVTCDATWTRWSQYYVDDASGRRSPINAIVPPEDFRDLWTVRAGFEHVAILPRLIVVPRFGALVEWLPAVTPVSSAGTADQASATSDLWLGLSAGLSVVQRRVIWDMAVQVRRGNDVGAGEYAPPDQTADVTITTAKLGVTIPF